jgi:hypothetical protein
MPRSPRSTTTIAVARAAPPSPPRQTRRQLLALQRQAARVIMRPLDDDWQTPRTWVDGRPTNTVVEGFIKPNSRLTSFERIEIYNRQYWFRLYDCLYDDFPGLRAVLGEAKFESLIRAYLVKYPSRSFTLRNLGMRLGQFVREEPSRCGRKLAIAADMVDFELAQVVAFDGPSRPAIGVDDLRGRDPSTLRLGLQPYLSLLAMKYPLDDFVIALKRRDAALRSEASNAIDTSAAGSRRSRQAALPRRRRTYVGVHRFDNALYYKRLDAPAYAILCALRDGHPLADACEAGARATNGRLSPATITSWFESWGQLGWLCRRASNGKRSA